MIISINCHYVTRKMSGLARYASELDRIISANGCGKVCVGLPKFFYKNSGRVRRYVRFLLLSIAELVIPAVLLFLRKADVHISPAFSVTLPIRSSRTIIIFHDLSFLEYPAFYSQVERIFFQAQIYLLKIGKHYVVTPSREVKSQLESMCGIRSNRISVIAPTTWGGKYADLYSDKYQSLGNRKDFMLLSNGHPRKNIENTIEGYLNSLAPSYGQKLIIAGNFERQPVFRNDPNIQLVTNLSDKDLAKMLQSCRALLLFSYSEGFGIPVVEAARCGAVSLTSEVSSLKELVSPGRDLWVALTAEEITKKIDMFLTCETYQKILRDDRDYVLSTFTDARFSNAWIDLINLVGGVYREQTD